MLVCSERSLGTVVFPVLRAVVLRFCACKLILAVLFLVPAHRSTFTAVSWIGVYCVVLFAYVLCKALFDPGYC